GEVVGVVLGDAARQQPRAGERRRRPHDDHRRDEVAVHQRPRRRRRAVPVVDVVEPELAPVRHVHGLVVERHLERVGAAGAPLRPAQALAGHPPLRLPDHADELDHRRRRHLPRRRGYLHREDGVAPVAGLQAEHLAGAGEEAELDGRGGVGGDGARPALPELGDDDVEGGADLAGAGGGGVLRLELAEVGGGEVEGDVLERQHGELRQRAGLDVRVREAVARPDRLHPRLREAAGEVADGVHELGGAGAVRHRVVGAQPDHEAAAGERRHLQITLLCGSTGHCSGVGHGTRSSLDSSSGRSRWLTSARVQLAAASTK
ncbi:hypothetical protein EE612_035104, partial [Oryza sativa]